MENLLKWNRPQNLSLSLQDAVVHHHHGVVAILEVCEGPGEHQVECGDHQAEVPVRAIFPPPFFVLWWHHFDDLFEVIVL